MDDQRDYAEEKYNREFCPGCGTSPCQWDGVTPDDDHPEPKPRPWSVTAVATAILHASDGEAAERRLRQALERAGFTLYEGDITDAATLAPFQAEPGTEIPLPREWAA